MYLKKDYVWLSSNVLKVYMTDFFICLNESKWYPDTVNIKNYFSISIFLPRAFAV